MDLLCVSLLLLLIERKAQGVTNFLYLEKNAEVQMFCQHRNWQIDIDYDHKVDCNITVESGDGESREDKDEDIEAGKHCSWTNSKKNTGTKDSTNCLKVNNPKEKHGFFACVDTLKSQHIYPFKYSDQAEYFIIAYAAENAVKEKRQDSHIRIHEGESINLMCNFNIQSNLSNHPYVMYWIRASSESSNVTCVYSYEYSNHEPFFDFHCPIGKDFLTRVSNTTSDNPLGDHRFHNLTISNGLHSDSGHYVCALNVIKGKKGFWAVIANITVTVDRQGPSDPNATDGERTTSRITPNTKVTIDKTEQPNQNAIQPPGANLTPLYVVLAITVVIVPAITIYIRKKGNIAKESKFEREQRHQSEEESGDIDLSGRELEPYSVVQLAAPPADSVERDQSELSAEPYSIVMQNSLYEASGPPQGDNDSSKPRTEHLAGNMKQPEGPVDTGAHVYEAIKDTISTC